MWVPDRCVYCVGSGSLSFHLLSVLLYLFSNLRGLQSKKNASTMAFQKGAKIIAGAGGSGYTLAVSALL